MERCLLPEGMAARCLLDTKLGGGYQGERLRLMLVWHRAGGWWTVLRAQGSDCTTVGLFPFPLPLPFNYSPPSLQVASIAYLMSLV